MNDYINKTLDEKLNKILAKNNEYESGRVIKVTNFIIEVVGFENLTFFEEVKIENYGIGYVNAILENSVIIAVLKAEKAIKLLATVMV